jgi:hypothetical protein
MWPAPSVMCRSCVATRRRRQSCAADGWVLDLLVPRPSTRCRRRLANAVAVTTMKCVLMLRAHRWLRRCTCSARTPCSQALVAPSTTAGM